MEIKKEYAFSALYSAREDKIRYIVIHFTGDSGATAKNEADYFSKNKAAIQSQSSAHYFVDAKDIYKSVPEHNTAWHCGLGNQSGFDTPHHPLYKKCTNNNSIGIEMCIDSKGKLKYDTIMNVRSLVRTLMKRYGINAAHVVRHYDVTGKECPNCHFYKKDGKLSDNSLLNSGTWERFKDLITK